MSQIAHARSTLPLLRSHADRDQRTLIAAGIAVIVVLYVALLLPGHAVNVLVEEDGLIEWLGALGLFAACGCFAAAFVVARRRGASSGLSRIGVWMLLALAVLMFVGGGEEISWGQRIFGWHTSAAVGAVNAQDETNLHNLQQLHGVLDVDRLFHLGWLGLFVVVPLVALLPRWRARLGRLLPIAPIAVAVLLVVSWVGMQIAVPILDHVSTYDSIYSPGHAASEIQESIAEVLIGIAALAALTALRRRRLP